MPLTRPLRGNPRKPPETPGNPSETPRKPLRKPCGNPCPQARRCAPQLSQALISFTFPKHGRERECLEGLLSDNAAAANQGDPGRGRGTWSAPIPSQISSLSDSDRLENNLEFDFTPFGTLRRLSWHRGGITSRCAAPSRLALASLGLAVRGRGSRHRAPH